MQSKEELTREETIRASHLLKALERHNDAFEFKYPVDYVGLEIPDYPEIVKCPMDLSTVRKNLKAGEYSTLSDFMMDLQLIWDNCKLYNPSDSLIAQQAGRLHEFMVKYCTDNGLPLPSVKRKPKEPTITFQEKKELSQVVKGLSTNELAHITIIVQQNCPEAYVQLEKQKVMILLEKLNYPTYNKIKEYSQAANH